MGTSRALLTMVVSLWVAAGSAEAAVYNVDPGKPDAPDASPGTGGCDDGAGHCTLRAAVMEANASAGLDQIVLPAGTVTLTISDGGGVDAATGDLDLLEEVEISGSGTAATTVEQTAADRVFSVDGGTPVSLEDLTVTGGSVSEEEGGAILVGSGASLALRRVALSGNSVTAATATPRGGAIVAYLNTSVEIEDSTIANNSAHKTGATGAPTGGGIWFGGSALTIRRSAIGPDNDAVDAASGSAGGGGGLFILGGANLIEDTTIFQNHAPRGGGIFRSSGGGTLTLLRSTVSGNQTTSSGGGVVNFGEIKAVSTTLSGNAAGSDGGGVRIDTGSLTVLGSTIAANTAVGPGDGIAKISGTVTLGGSILANDDNCSGSGYSSAGGNVEQGGDAACGLGGSDLSGADLSALEPLADNGGYTETHAIAPGSPALDYFSTGCPLAAPGDTDQRGFARPAGGACDAGAFEYTDSDTDGAEDGTDNCPATANPGQADSDLDGIGDACEPPPAPAPAPSPAPAPAPGPPPPSSAGAQSAPTAPAVPLDTVAPRFSGRLAVTRRFRISRRSTPVSARRRTRIGGNIVFRLSEPAAVTLELRRLVRGVRLVSGERLRCRTASRRNMRRAKREVRRAVGRRATPAIIRRALRARRCTAQQRRGRLRRQARQGRNRIAFSGRVGRRRLPTGRYRLVARAADPAGNRSRTKRSSVFRIVRR